MWYFVLLYKNNRSVQKIVFDRKLFNFTIWLRRLSGVIYFSFSIVARLVSTKEKTQNDS